MGRTEVRPDLRNIGRLFILSEVTPDSTLPLQYEVREDCMLVVMVAYDESPCQQVQDILYNDQLPSPHLF